MIMENYKIQVWATNKEGEGMVMDLGIYDSIEDIEIRTSHLSNDLKITFEQVWEKD